MNTFHVINKLILKQGELLCYKPTKRSLQKAHYRQGDLDGACGAYSIVMALSICGVFNADDIQYDKKPFDGRTVEWKLINELNSNGLYREGLECEDCEDILLKYHKYITVDKCSDASELFSFIKEELDNNNPLMVDITFKGGGHWIVVVGYMLDDSGKLVKLLTLDPGEASPTYAMWNGTIDLEKLANTRYPYVYETMSMTQVKLHNALSIQCK